LVSLLNFFHNHLIILSRKMVQIDDKIISLDVFEKKFCCNLAQCHGQCCVDGDSGAPMTDEEIEIIEKYFPIIKNYMHRNGIKTIEEVGFYTIDTDGDKVTPLIKGKECAYVYFDKKIALCAIEKAFLEGKIDFQKPVSCHLYPIRLKKFATFEAVNYDQWELCEPALLHGEVNGIPLYAFLKTPLIRKYGEAWYEQMEIAAKELEEMEWDEE